MLLKGNPTNSIFSIQVKDIDSKEIKYYLGIIRDRINANQTGSKWMVRSKRKLRKTLSTDVAGLLLTSSMYDNQESKKPVHEWKLADVDLEKISKMHDKLYKVMTTELFVVNENDLVELVVKIMEWKNIHHLPVVNEHNKIIGIITTSNLDLIDIQSAKNNLVVAEDIMVKDVISVNSETFIEEAKKIMAKNKIGCLPIIDGDDLIGIVTRNDLKRIDKYANIKG